MKKLIIKLLLLTFLCFPIKTYALATNSDYDNIKVYLFYQDNSKKCDKVKEEIEKELDNNKRVSLEVINVSDNEELNKEVRKELNIKNDKVPLIVIGSNYFNKYNKNFKNALENYQEVSEYCDLVNEIRNNGDIKKCIDSNKNIYNENNTIKYVVVIIISLSLIIGIVLVIKKKYKR